MSVWWTVDVFAIGSGWTPVAEVEAGSGADWARESRGNLLLVAEYGLAVAAEYRRRYGRTHASEAVVRWCLDRAEQAPIPAGPATERPPSRARGSARPG